MKSVIPPPFQPVKDRLRAKCKGAAPTNHVPQDDDQTQSSSSTRSTLTVLTDTSKVPMSVIKAAARQRQIVDQMGRSHVHHHAVFEHSIAESRADATAFAALTRPTLHCEGRWVSIRRMYSLEKLLAADFFNVLVTLVGLWKEQPMRSSTIGNIIDTHNTFIPDDRDPTHFLRPDVFIQGTDSLFPVRPSTRKAPNWCSCIATGDAKLYQEKGEMDTFGQLGTYAEQVFSAQENRRFIHTSTLIIFT